MCLNIELHDLIGLSIVKSTKYFSYFNSIYTHIQILPVFSADVTRKALILLEKHIKERAYLYNFNPTIPANCGGGNLFLYDFIGFEFLLYRR